MPTWRITERPNGHASPTRIVEPCSLSLTATATTMASRKAFVPRALVNVILKREQGGCPMRVGPRTGAFLLLLCWQARLAGIRRVANSALRHGRTRMLQRDSRMMVYVNAEES